VLVHSYPVGRDLALSIDECDRTAADLLAQEVVDGILLVCVVLAIRRLGPEVRNVIRGAAQLEGMRWSSS
jgi:hypothetical protein